VQNITFDSQPLGEGEPDAISVAGHNIAVRDCVFLNLGDAMNANQNPAGLVVQGNDAPLNKGLHSYFVWMQGTDLVIQGNHAANSTREHIVRGYAWERVQITHNDFANTWDPNDPADFSKATINLQPGKYASVIGNHLADGDVQIGPLYVQDGTTENVIFENNTMEHNVIHVVAGGDHVLIQGNTLSYDNANLLELSKPDDKGRDVHDVIVNNNHGTNNGIYGSFIRFAGGFSDVAVTNNTFTAPNLVLNNQSASLSILVGDVSGLSKVENNQWSKMNLLGDHYVAAAEWLAQAKVSGDVFV
jgi:hypothetical protein